MTFNHDRQQAIVTVILLITAIAAPVLMGYDSSTGWIKGVAGYIVWVLVPYVLLLALHLVNCVKRMNALLDREVTWSWAIIAIAGPLFYIDIRFLNVDAQGAIAMLMVPILQFLGIGFIVVIAFLWHHVANGKANWILSLLNKATLATLLIYMSISALQYSNTKTIYTAKEVNYFINQYCKNHGALPQSSQLQARFPDLTTNAGWFFFTDDATWLKMQYPVKWSNSRALGKVQISEFTATPYAYIVEYRCGKSND